MEKPEKELLNEKPRNPKTGILTKEFMIKIFLQGGFIAFSTMVVFHQGLESGNKMVASTMAFATLTLARLFHGFNLRSERSIFQIGFFSNLYSIGAFFVGVVLLHLVLLVPFLQRLFETATLNMTQLFTIYFFGVLPTIVIQLIKLIFFYKKYKNK